MSALGSADLQNSAGGNLASQSDQPDVRNVLRPFCGELGVDEELKLSCENFIQSIEDFFRHKNITPLSQLAATSPFPTLHVLAQFASKTYRDYKKRETDAQYETRLDLPDGWKLLTTASNASKTNGYFGAAYWQPEHQQVVIAHRGTKPTNVGALWTDLKGVVHNEYVRQMESASTFAHKVLEVLRDVSETKGVSFQLFFTGHSLGGWLAQVTTFSTEYLKRVEKYFLGSNDDNDCYHPHTVVFDSPGCKDMLLQMADKLDVRLDGLSIDIGHLDITSYLSAPNRINTCNKHVGTVYRIFPDLSDMGWWKRNTALYNLATHSMLKIKEAFDAETGQVHEDEQGRLKLQVVIDWPISAGLKHGKEYKNFFKRAKYLKNYHPDIQDVTLGALNYCPIRYQTKIYDKRANRLSIFSQEEQEFLQCYLKLRQWPKLFKPKELFSVMEENKAQQKAEKLLQGFEIENDTIYCTDHSALQALVPYVKRLLRLFPHIKEIRNWVYQCETRSCMEQINRSPLEFNSNPSSLREILESEQQNIMQIQMIDGDEWTGLIKVYQLLQQNKCLIEDQYTVLKLERFLTLNMLMDFRTIMLSIKTPYQMLVACEPNELLKPETKDMIKTLFETMKEKPSIKFILTTRSENEAVNFLQQIGREIFGSGFVTRDEKLTWSDLTSSSQEKLLKKSVKFQGAFISLNEIMSAECQVANFLPLGALLEEKELTIADPVPIANAYNEGYYIGRTLRHQTVIKKSILSDIGVRYSHFYLARTEKEYKDLCKKFPGSIVHWLQEDKSGNLVWQQTQGSLETVRRFIDPDSLNTYTADDLDKLLELVEHQRVMLISDTAGMGKSTLMTHLSKQMKQKFPAKWVVRIDLNDHTDALKALKQEQIDKDKAIEFVAEKVLKRNPGLELELFKQSFEQKQKLRLVIMLDGFDEISPIYKEAVIDLLQALRQTAVEQLWVTTRPHLRKNLEDKLQQLSYTMEPFSEENQVEFLTKFWSLKDWFAEMDSNKKEKCKQKLEMYAEQLIKKLSISISDKDRLFTGIPLQTLMLAEAFDKEVKIFCQSSESMPELKVNLELIELYRRFIGRKYDIYQEEKVQIRVSNVAGIGQRERDLKTLREDHQLLALKVLFTEEQVELFQNNTEISSSTEELTRIGIVQVSDEGKPHFIHRTFAEYYVADCLVNRLKQGNKTSEKVQKFILKDIFLKLNYEVIRVFINGLLSRSEHSDEVLKQCGCRIHDLGNDCVLTLHRAAQEGNGNIVAILLDSLQAAEHTDTVVQLLLAKDDERKTAWIMATERGNLQVLEKLWECANKNLTTEEININLLLATDYLGRTVLHMAAVFGGLEIIQKVWAWFNEKLTTQEINNKILLATDKEGKNILHMAANWSRLEIIQKVWEWANERLKSKEINNLLLATDDEGRTVFHMAVMFGGLEILQKVWAWVNEKLTTEEINNKLLLVTDDERRNIFHMATKWSRPEILEKVWECANEKLTKEEINNNLLLATDGLGRTVLHMAAGSGRLEILEKVWAWANEKLTKEEIKNNLLLATNDLGRTLLHRAAVFGAVDILEKVWEWANEKLTTEEINNKLLLATDSKRRTVFHMAADHGTLEILQKVWEWANERLTKEEIKNNLLLATDCKERTVFYMAAEYGGLEKVEKVWDWANKRLTTEEINNKLLLATDMEGRTVFYMAADQNRLELLEKVWEWGNERLTTQEMKSNLLLNTDGQGRTAFHRAALLGGRELLEKIWEWANEKLTTEEINNKILFATDNEGRTVFHMAADQERLEILQKIWE